MRMANGLSFVRDFERLLGPDFFQKVKSFTPMQTETENVLGELTTYMERIEELGGIDLLYLGLGPEAEAASHLCYIKPGCGAGLSHVNTTDPSAWRVPCSPEGEGTASATALGTPSWVKSDVGVGSLDAGPSPSTATPIATTAASTTSPDTTPVTARARPRGTASASGSASSAGATKTGPGRGGAGAGST